MVVALEISPSMQWPCYDYIVVLLKYQTDYLTSCNGSCGIGNMFSRRCHENKKYICYNSKVRNAVCMEEMAQ